MEKRKIVFYLTIGMILILHLTACTNRSSELPAPDSTVFGYEGETKIIFDGVCAKYNDKKEKNQVFLPIVQVLGTYEEGNITKIVSCVSLTEMSLEEGNLTIAGTNIFPMVTEIKYEKNFQYLSTDGKTIGEVERKLNLETQVQAPVKKGETAGTLEYYRDGQKLGEINILFTETIEKATYKNCLEKIITEAF